VPVHPFLGVTLARILGHAETVGGAGINRRGVTNERVVGLASHPDPESCACSRKAQREALTGAHAGRVIEPRNVEVGSLITRPLGIGKSRCTKSKVEIGNCG